MTVKKILEIIEEEKARATREKRSLQESPTANTSVVQQAVGHWAGLIELQVKIEQAEREEKEERRKRRTAT